MHINVMFNHTTGTFSDTPKHIASTLREEKSESGDDMSKFHDTVNPPQGIHYHHNYYYDDDPGISKHQASASLELTEEESVWKESGEDVSKFHDTVIPCTPGHSLYHHIDDDPGISKHLASASLELTEEESVWKESEEDISKFHYTVIPTQGIHYHHIDDDLGIYKHQASASLEFSEGSESGEDISKFHDVVIPPQGIHYNHIDDPGISKHLALSM